MNVKTWSLVIVGGEPTFKIWWSDTLKEHTRKSTEKKIKAFTKEIAEVQNYLRALDVVVESDLPESDGDWNLYLSPDRREQRGREMNICLGASVGGYGDHYMAVGYKSETYGFYVLPGGRVELDQYKGYENAIIPNDRVAEACEVAERWVHKNSIGHEDESPEVTHLLQRLRALELELRHYRHLEWIRARIDGRIVPKAEVVRTYTNPATRRWYGEVVVVDKIRNPWGYMNSQTYRWAETRSRSLRVKEFLEFCREADIPVKMKRDVSSNRIIYEGEITCVENPNEEFFVEMIDH